MKSCLQLRVSQQHSPSASEASLATPRDLSVTLPSCRIPLLALSSFRAGLLAVVLAEQAALQWLKFNIKKKTHNPKCYYYYHHY